MDEGTRVFSDVKEGTSLSILEIIHSAPFNYDVNVLSYL